MRNIIILSHVTRIFYDVLEYIFYYERKLLDIVPATSFISTPYYRSLGLFRGNDD